MVILLSCNLTIESGEEYFDVDYDFDKLVELSKKDYNMLSDEEKVNVNSLTVTQYKIEIPPEYKGRSAEDVYWDLYRDVIGSEQFDRKTRWFTDESIVKQVKIV